jgi:hypothetical protein
VNVPENILVIGDIALNWKRESFINHYTGRIANDLLLSEMTNRDFEAHWRTAQSLAEALYDWCAFVARFALTH